MAVVVLGVVDVPDKQTARGKVLVEPYALPIFDQEVLTVRLAASPEAIGRMVNSAPPGPEWKRGPGRVEWGDPLR